MDPKKRERLKEEELAHLREIQRLKRLAKHARRQKRLNQAMAEITGALDKVTGQDDGLLAEIEFESIRSEARIDMAMESKSNADAPIDHEKPQKVESQAEENSDPAPQAKTIGSFLKTP